MTTLIDAVMPTEEHLEQALQQEALAGRTEDAFTASYLAGVSKQLSDNPTIYRAYGPWWPEIKRLIIETEVNQSFGQGIDADVKAIYSLTRPALTVIAAHLYSAERIESGYIYSAYHELPVHEDADDTEPYLYVSNDDEIEKLIAIRG
ncbi:olxA [Pantoea sp. LMR881]|uniref:olxA n=1 Tax=Pantoea sp. LMR881 TaxID=3014336 RepID=UPI0022AEF9E9|nr:olxA [Pantoea sp. LMR881]MCZ4061215.1 olxA [Pantoea sp. LMR881]MCZ4061329.1 olxA [Pantoea sp. LMR881]